jgi:hypothetical protein
LNSFLKSVALDLTIRPPPSEREAIRFIFVS